MTAIYRVTSRDGASIGETDSVDGIIEVVKDGPPGRYRISKFSPDPGTGELRSWELGTVSKSRKGRITLDLPPWMD